MSLVNQYWGATQEIPGATYLDSRALLRVQEGYQIGGTIEYVDIGDFKIENFTNEGPFRQTLQIEAANQLQWLNRVNTVVPYRLNNHAFYDDRFTNENTLTDNYYQTGPATWDVSSDALTGVMDTQDRGLLIYKNSDIADGRIIWKFQFDDTDYNYGVIFRAQDTSTTENAYTIQIRSTSDLIHLYRYIDGNAVSLASADHGGLSVDTDYWLMVVFRGGNVKVYISTDGESYTKYIDHTDYTYKDGLCGIRLRNPDNTERTVTTDEFDFVEIGRQYTQEDIIRKSLMWGGIENVKIQDDERINGNFSDFDIAVGSSWFTGLTNGYYQADYKGTSREWNLYMHVGESFTDFSIDCEISGSSGAEGGIAVGPQDDPTLGVFLNWYKFGSTNNVVDYTEYSSGNQRYSSRGEYSQLGADIWYKSRMMRRGNYIFWYINDVLVNSAYNGIGEWQSGDAVSIGFGAKGISGTILSVRDTKISILDSFIDDADFSIGSNVGSVIQRYIPEDISMNMQGNTFNIFRLGSTHDAGTSNIGISYVNGTESINNINIASSTGRGNEYLSIEDDVQEKIRHRVDYSNSNAYNNVNILQQESADMYTSSSLFMHGLAVNVNEVNIMTHPQLENGDFIDYVNIETGVSHRLIVRSNKKTYSSEEGAFRQTLQLSQI